MDEMYKLRHPFAGHLAPEIKEYLESKWPEEAGVLVADNKVYRLENEAQDRDNVFEFDEGIWLDLKRKTEIQALIHSHNDWPHVSEGDMIGQQMMGCPWGILSIKNGRTEDAFFWGDQLEPDGFIGRPFHHGVHDCYGLVRDYYKRERGIWIRQFNREYGWWKQDPPLNLLVDGYKSAGFIEIPYEEAQVGDVLFFKIRYKVVNHSAIYLGKGLMLHHFCAPGVVSRREPVQRWKSMMTHCLRYVGEDNV